MIYFTSDLHFSHKKLVERDGYTRPFSSIEEMNQTLIDNWNETVSENDIVYILGDFTLRGVTHAMELLQKLNGSKCLIRGNHDEFAEKDSFDKSLLLLNKSYHEERIWVEELDKEIHLILSHFPFMAWNNMPNGSIHLHGHVHSKTEYNKQCYDEGLFCYDVGVDANNFKPISLLEILDKLPTFQPIDYHLD